MVKIELKSSRLIDNLKLNDLSGQKDPKFGDSTLDRLRQFNV